jgi:DNA-directed RNA polymerase subunit RPC12/RpoP
MRPIRPVEPSEIKAHARCGACGKTRELSGEELHGAADMEGLKELQGRLRCTDCGERAVTLEPTFHPDWRG